MLSKPCANCRKLYNPQEKEGLGLVFCSPCKALCEKAREDIIAYMRRCPNVPVGKVVGILKTPSMFVYHLLRLKSFDSPSEANSGKACSVCGNALKATETVYCEPCEAIVSKRTHSLYKN